MSAARGALLLLFDVDPASAAEHDDWHTHEHLGERLALPGFLRGSRWARPAGSPRYCVVYEVAGLAALASEAYRARLDAPTPRTRAIMPRYAGMRRSLCTIVAGAGDGLGGHALVVTLAPRGDAQAALARLAAGPLAGLADRRGVVSWRLLSGALAAPMTREQALRGRDDAVQAALWITGYDPAALEALAEAPLADAALDALGVPVAGRGRYALAHALAAG